MSVLTRHAVRGLLQPHAPPCVSLYQPTHRHHPDNRRDSDSLQEPAARSRVVDGLAVLGAPAPARGAIERPVSGALRDQAIGAGRRGEPRCPRRTGGRDVSRGHRDRPGRRADRTTLGQSPPMAPALEGRAPCSFGAVHRATIAQFSTPSELPLVLAALPEHQPVFRRLSQNAALLERGVDGDPEAMSAEQLRHAAWQAVEPTSSNVSPNFRTGSGKVSQSTGHSGPCPTRPARRG